ncbi:MAG: HlyD family type I secretion periplasmic adaptor subunit [Pseudomonadota bacterium]
MKATGALSREALDFAPGLLAIQESPPPRLPRAVLYSVAVLFGILLVWAIFGQLDVVAAAEGRLVPQTYVKIVQPAEGGIVRDILVREGQSVEAGQVLMRMDAALTEADARALRNDFELKRLQLRRIEAELAAAPMAREPGDSPDLFAQVVAQHAAHRQAYLDALAEEQAVLEKTRHDLRAAEEVLRKLEETVPMYRKSAGAFEKLGKEGFYGTIAVEEKRRELIEKEQELRAQQATVASLRSTIDASEKKLAQISSSYRSALQDERVETESQFNRLREELQKIEHKSGLLALRAPQRGIVKDLATHTAGTVVSPGTVLMTLVPHDEPLQAEVYVRNEDVGFVHEGQRVKVKLAAYPFQKYGMLDGEIAHVGADAADLGTTQAQSVAQSPEGGNALRYKALVRLEIQHLDTDGRRLGLTPGMQVVADIHLGQRTVMEYLLSPVQKAWFEAGRER